MSTAVALAETKLQRLIGITLRSGVMIASVTGITGGFIYLTAHSSQPVSFRVFDGLHSSYASPEHTVREALALHGGNLPGHGLAIAQLGIIMLLLTPIIRVALSIVGFAIERDHTYVVITSIVLATLTVSLLLH